MPEPRRSQLPLLTWTELEFLANAIFEKVDGQEGLTLDPLGNGLYTAVREAQYAIDREQPNALDDRPMTRAERRRASREAKPRSWESRPFAEYQGGAFAHIPVDIESAIGIMVGVTVDPFTLSPALMFQFIDESEAVFRAVTLTGYHPTLPGLVTDATAMLNKLSIDPDVIENVVRVATEAMAVGVNPVDALGGAFSSVLEMVRELNPERPSGLHVDEMLAWVLLDDGDNNEAVPAFKSPDNDMVLPLMGADRERMEQMRGIAKILAVKAQHPIQLRRWVAPYEVIETVGP